eukprot:1472291-Rhodomonas_salina.1
MYRLTGLGFGVSAASNYVYGDFYVYNGTLESLELFQNLTLAGSPLSRPGPRRYHGIAAASQVVYLFGGENSGEALTSLPLGTLTYEPIAELKGFDRATRTWEDYTAGVGGSAPSARVFPSIAADAHKLYVFGPLPSRPSDGWQRLSVRGCSRVMMRLSAGSEQAGATATEACGTAAFMYSEGTCGGG